MLVTVGFVGVGVGVIGVGVGVGVFVVCAEPLMSSLGGRSA